MNPKDDLKNEIDNLSSTVWGMTGEEQGKKMHELIWLYDQLLQHEIDPYFIYENKARIYLHLKECSKAESVVQNMIEISPQSNLAWSLLADAQFESGKYKEALNSLDKCISFEFVSDFRYEFRSKINKALGNHAEADKDLKIYNDYQAREKAKWDDPNHYYHYK